MSSLHWIRKLLSFVTFLGVIKRCRRQSSLLKIEAAKAYVLGVEKTRFFLLGALLVLFSLILFAGGWLLIHIALFVYSGWSVPVKLWMAFLLGGLEIVFAIGIVFYLFREETWVRFSGINHVVKSVIKERK